MNLGNKGRLAYKTALYGSFILRVTGLKYVPSLGLSHLPLSDCLFLEEKQIQIPSYASFCQHQWRLHFWVCHVTKMVEFGDGPSGGKQGQMRWWVWDLVMRSQCSYNKTSHESTEERPCEGTVKSSPSAGQEASSYQELNRLASCSCFGLSGLPNCEE